MNYELAKQLKDAGFLLKICGLESYHGMMGVCYDPRKIFVFDNERYHEPTLSELIEACVDSFKCLELVNTREDYKWEASADYYCCDEHGNGRHFRGGSTPEEAVANLFIALNK